MRGYASEWATRTAMLDEVIARRLRDPYETWEQTARWFSSEYNIEVTKHTLATHVSCYNNKTRHFADVEVERHPPELSDKFDMKFLQKRWDSNLKLEKKK